MIHVEYGRWSQEEIDFLIDLRKQNVSLQDIKRYHLPHRSISSMSCKLKKLRKDGDKSLIDLRFNVNRKPPKKLTKEIAKDIHEMRKQGKTLNTISIKHGVSMSCISNWVEQIDKLGIEEFLNSKSKYEWTDQDDKKIKHCSENKIPLSEIKRDFFPNRSESAISKRASALGLSLKHSCNETLKRPVIHITEAEKNCYRNLRGMMFKDHEGAAKVKTSPRRSTTHYDHGLGQTSMAYGAF